MMTHRSSTIAAYDDEGGPKSWTDTVALSKDWRCKAARPARVKGPQDWPFPLVSMGWDSAFSVAEICWCVD